MTSTSRHRTNIATLFDVFTEIAGVDAGSSQGTGSPQPLILQKYPEDYNDEGVLRSVRQFAFPCGLSPEDVSDGAVQLFSFVLTDSASRHTFGYCRYTPRTNTCICILSGYAWTNVFYKLLNHISVVMNNGTQEDVDALLTRVYHTEAPAVGEHLRVSSIGGKHMLDVEIPDLSLLPTLKDDKFMLEFYNAVTPRQMISIYASLLKERRILFTGKKLGQLSSCVHAAATLLYPMAWQSLFIPVLPEPLKDMMMAPMPFLMGVPKQFLEPHTATELGDVMVIDLDEKSLQGPHDDLADLPAEVQALLKSGLKAGIDMGDTLSRVFLRANVQLFGGYRSGLSRNEGTTVVSWDKEKFLSEQRPSFQPFLTSLLGTDGVQYLERFIDERLKALNTGAPISDEFEREAVGLDQKIRSQVRDNASDVLGALKDRVKSIEIRDKLGRLTPKEIRKNKAVRSRSARRSENNGVEPLSFENIQWTEQSESRDSPSSVPSSDVGDLIDLGDTPTQPSLPSLPPSQPPLDFSDLLSTPSVLPSLPPRIPPRPSSVPVPTSVPPSNPFLASSSKLYTNPFYNLAPPPPPPRPFTNIPPQQTTNTWERFE